jgi:pimeloyl-ACP methyl ester carboxylesterase
LHFSILAAVMAGFILLMLGGWLYQQIGTARDQQRHPAPGELVNLGGHRLHCLVKGEGSPAVIFESGLMSTVLSWQALQPEIAKVTRTVCYDRAGLGWSDPGPEERDAEQIVSELQKLLEQVQIAPPYVLVGHSFGGLTIRLFAARYPEQVAALVLIDPVVPGEWNPPGERNERSIRVGSRILRRAASVSRLGVLRFLAFLLHSGATAIADPFVRLVSRGAPNKDGTTKSPLFWNLPPAERAMARVFWVQPKFPKTIASQLQHLPTSAAEVAAAPKPENIKSIVISAANTPVERREEQIATARLSSCGKHLTSARGGHWVMEDDPDIVLQAIREVVERARETCTAGAHA